MSEYHHSCKQLWTVRYVLIVGWLFGYFIGQMRTFEKPVQYISTRHYFRPISNITADIQQASTNVYAKWTSLEDLLDVNFTSKRLAIGCPPLPSVCKLHHIFDEIMIISLPRFYTRYMTIINQLNEMNVPYTLVHARDGRSPEYKQIAEHFLYDKRDQISSIFSLYLTQIGILNYLKISPLRSILILEDDVIFRADFPVRFDRFARNLPEDWRVLWLGLNVELGYRLDSESIPIDWKGGENNGFTTLPSPYEERGDAGFFGAFSVGFHRDAASLVLQTMLENRTVIDTLPYITLLQTWPNQSFIASPPLAIMNISAQSTLRGNVVSNSKIWNSVNNIDYRWFNVNKGFYVGGESGVVYHCATQTGVDKSGNDLKLLVAESANECCAHCKSYMPFCTSWTWNPGIKMCWLKHTLSDGVPSEPTFVSGILIQSS